MKIALFFANIEFSVGGAESYFANFFEYLQNMYSDSEFEVITTFTQREKRLSSSQLAENMNKAYGTHITPNFCITHIPYKNQGAFLIMRGYLWYSNYTKKFDVCFNCTKFTLISKAKKNYAIIHFPYSYANTNIVAKYTFLKPLAKYFDRLWRKSCDRFLCNSEYTALWLKRLYKINNSCIDVLYPAVLLMKPQERKKRQIFICSRFDRTKSIHILIKAFRMMTGQDVRLVIAGAKLNDKEEKYYQELKNLAKGLNVEFKLNPSRHELEDLYGESLVFWHARGIEIEEEKRPDLVEHFGIVTVEAMSAGCIPIVINKGGQKEIVDEGINGFKWNTIEELIEKTSAVLQCENVELLRKNAIEKSHNYGIEAFSKSLHKILQNL